MTPFWVTLGGIGALLLAAPLSADRGIPPAPFGEPNYYVLDETPVLPSTTRAAIQRLLTEHDRVNDEQVIVAIFKSAGGEEPQAFAQRVFNEWKVGGRGKDNGALLSLFIEERAAMLDAGSGLEATLGSEEREAILSETVRPSMRRANPTRAAALGTVAMLEALHSPLVSGGKAEALIRAGGIEEALEEAPAPEDSSYGWWLWVALGGIVFSGAFLIVTAADAHFTGGGWFRPSPWRLARWKTELWNPASARKHLGGTHGTW